MDPGRLARPPPDGNMQLAARTISAMRARTGTHAREAPLSRYAMCIYVYGTSHEPAGDGAMAKSGAGQCAPGTSAAVLLWLPPPCTPTHKTHGVSMFSLYCYQNASVGIFMSMLSAVSRCCNFFWVVS